MSYLEVVGPQFLGSIPFLLAWLGGIILAVYMLRRGGGKAEKLLLAGCALMFGNQIVRPFLFGLSTLLVHEHGMSRASAAGLIVSIPTTILSVAGIVCLLTAFWTRWKTKPATL